MTGIFAAEQLQHYGYSTWLNVFQAWKDPQDPFDLEPNIV